MRHVHWRSLVSLLVLSLGVGGCSAIDYAAGPVLEREETWALLPMVNHTETPQAGRRAEAITEALLHSRGVMNVRRYPQTLLQKDATLLTSDQHLYDAALRWAKAQDLRYALTGTVDEWRYKVGVDGEPAVGVSLRVVDLDDETVIWSAVGGKAGWSREAVSAVAQQLIKRLLEEADIS